MHQSAWVRRALPPRTVTADHVRVSIDDAGPAPIRVVLADDDARVLDAARDALEQNPDVRVVATATDGDAVRRLVAREQVDVVVMDLGMPGGGVELVRHLRSGPAGRAGTGAAPVGVVVVTASDDVATCTELVRAGSRCIVSKYGVDVDLGRCVVRCHHGDVVLVGTGPASVLDHLIALATA
jgi:DNA-binding NarL/FixJ family response regulator